jgi:hypothetical protein
MKICLFLGALIGLSVLSINCSAASVLQIQIEHLSWGNGWNTAVQEFRVSTGADGMIREISFAMQGGRLPEQKLFVKRSGREVGWSWNQPGLGKHTFFLQKTEKAWEGTASFTSSVRPSESHSRPIRLIWGPLPARPWADEQRVASVNGKHYWEQRVVPDTQTQWTDIYEYTGGELLEHYRDQINARFVFHRNAKVVSVERLEQPDDGGWTKQGWATLKGSSLATKNPAIDALNWKILNSVLPEPVFLPFLLELGL